MFKLSLSSPTSAHSISTLVYLTSIAYRIGITSYFILTNAYSQANLQKGYFTFSLIFSPSGLCSLLSCLFHRTGLSLLGLIASVQAGEAAV